MGNSALAANSRTNLNANVINVGSRLKIAEVKERIHESKVCEVVIEMAINGVDEKGEEIAQPVRIDLLKFLVNKIIPNARDMGEVKDTGAMAKYASMLAREPQEASYERKPVSDSETEKAR